jgi:hypothetical protein
MGLFYCFKSLTQICLYTTIKPFVIFNLLNIQLIYTSIYNYIL